MIETEKNAIPKRQTKHLRDFMKKWKEMMRAYKKCVEDWEK